jgi:2-polyprenyl-6-methoxyphenol hydroxylase-like FAD-dependent oxidoreductase
MVVRVRRVLIVGAGIGGITAGLALRRANISTAIFERAGTLRDLQVGHGLSLWPNGTRILAKVGALEAVECVAAPIEQMEFRDVRGRRIVSHAAGDVTRELGAPTLGLRRSELHRSLLDVIGEDAVEFSAECVGIEQDDDGITARFADGRTERGDVLVAADGALSTIRKVLVGDAPTPTGNAEMHGTVPTPPDVPIGLYRQVWGPGAKFGFYPVRDATCWYCTVKASDPRFIDEAARKDAIRARLSTYPAPTASLLDAPSEHPITRAVITTHDLTKPWVHGRVALLGDAAHAMAPHLGQGAGQAIEDAFVVAECLRTNQDVTAALREYEHRRKKHVRGIAKQSRILGKGLVLEHPLAHAIWRNVVRMAWRPIGSKQYVKIHRYEA